MPVDVAPADGYFRYPTVHGDRVAFVAEDDLWLVPVAGGVARRLTANLAEVSHPCFSPDGRWIAFTSREEHHPEVWCMPADGGPARRITWLGGAVTQTVGWTPDGRVILVSNAAQPFAWWTFAYAVDPHGGEPEPLPLGPCRSVDYAANGAIVIGRHSSDPARWKRYRGGTAGQIWVDARGNGAFRRILPDLDGNPTWPIWVDGRIFFVADHEGIGNIYSCRPGGADLTRHSDHGEYYARFPRTDGVRIVYQHAAELWMIDSTTSSPSPIPVRLASPRVQRARKFVKAEDFLGDVGLHPRGQAIAVEARGQLFRMPLWEENVRPLGPTDGVRHRLATWLADGASVAAFSDDGGDEGLVVYDAEGESRRIESDEMGVAWEMAAAPVGDSIAVVNHRHELLVVDTAARAVRKVDASRFGHLADVTWSPDGRWLAYSAATSDRTHSIKVCEVATGTCHEVTRPEFKDYSPSFDPAGRYLYFLSSRIFDPVSDELFYELGFPRTVKPFALPLQAGTRSPFDPAPRGPAEQPPAAERAGEVSIDFDGIDRRAVQFPVPTGRYLRLAATPGRVLLLVAEIEGTLDRDIFNPKPPEHTVASYDFTGFQFEPLIKGVVDFQVSADGSTILYKSGNRLRALEVGKKPPEGEEGEGVPSRRNGWIDVGRIRVSVDPGAEWRQMFAEAWRLQRDYFWVPDMSGVDWRRVRDRYAPLVEKVGSRGDFSDLMWEMQGELGTSHAYERGGDYRPAPNYAMGFLGADFELDRRSGRWRVAHVVRADHWNPDVSSPLESPGVGVREGDTILAVNGRPLGRERSPQQELVHQAGLPVELTVADARGRRPRRVVVKTVRDELPLRYREWVEGRRRIVHEATGGRCGYVHIPNMGTTGFAEFHRSYLAEVARDALIVDVRDNAGGFVSQMILGRLGQRRIGYDVVRYGPMEPYPADSPAGPLVCLTNQNAGSDGDIFTHCFKLMDLGPVVGTRTWGGVIGISPRHRLADGSLTTQPAYSFWFVDVGWGVENYGTDPTVELDITPAQWAAGADPQLDRGIALVQRELRRFRPARPDLKRRPVLALPTLPARGR
jgi:tricorn protease